MDREAGGREGEVRGDMRRGDGGREVTEERVQALHSLSYEFWRGWFSLLYVSPTPSCPSPPQTQRPRACTHPDPAATATSHRWWNRKSHGEFESGVKRKRLWEGSRCKPHLYYVSHYSSHSILTGCDDFEACMIVKCFLFLMCGLVPDHTRKWRVVTFLWSHSCLLSARKHKMFAWEENNSICQGLCSGLIM